MAGSNMIILEEVLEFFVGMAEEIKHLTLIEDTFNESHMIGPAIEAVYIAIINFWVKAMDYYMDRLKSDIISRIKTWLTASGTLSVEFHKLRGRIAAQKTKLHELEASLYHADDKAERFRRQQADFRHRQKEVLDVISPPDYEHHFHTAKQYRHVGTCEWLRDKPKYKDWLEGETNSLLVIYGTAGLGKTVLSSWLVDESQSRTKRHTLYHFFKETDDSCNTALAATRSLLDQVYDVLLSSNHPLLESFESEMLELSRKKHVHFETLWSILSSFLSKYSERPQRNNTSSITIVLDALDECKNPNELVQGLHGLTLTASKNVYTVVTSRPGDQIDDHLLYANQITPTILELSQDDVARDIAALVDSSIKKIDRFYDPKLFNLRDRIIAEFSNVRNHQGMFLWAYLMCQEVKRPLSKAQILNLLKDLPRGLNNTYARICKRLSSNNHINLEFSRYVLQWVVASRRPMTFAELEEALKLATNEHDILLGKDFCDEDGNLLWSRKDVVRCCGDLVRYSGLDEGDTIGIVHLSAQQFLSTSLSKLSQQASSDISPAIEPFLVDIPSVELSMALICIKYILFASSDSDKYYSQPTLPRRARTLGQEVFKKRYPLFDYATIYWAEYAINAAQFQPDTSQLQQLLANITELTRSPISTIWLTELIYLTYIEYAQHVIWRLIGLDEISASPIILRWLHLVIRVLVDFSSTLSHHPHMLQWCLSHLYLPPTETFATIPLGASPRHWIHYDPFTENLFSLGQPTSGLRCQSLRTGVRSRPMSIPLEYLSDKVFICDSAALSPSANYIAAGYICAGARSISRVLGYLVVCWSINISCANSSIDDWATLVFKEFTLHDRSSLKQVFQFPLVQFIQDDRILMPHGAFDLKLKQYVDMPWFINDPNSDYKLGNTLFSGDHQRIVRVGGGMLEVLDTLGTSIYRHESGEELTLKAFSHSGCKVVTYSGGMSSLHCLVVDQAKYIDMSFPVQGYLEDAVFTRDGGRLVAKVSGQLMAWTFLQEMDGSYADRADMVNIFEPQDVDFVFDLIPESSEGSAQIALIIETGGNFIKQPLDLVSGSEKKATMMSWPLVSITQMDSAPPKLSRWSSWERDPLGFVRLERWSLELPDPKPIFLVDHDWPARDIYAIMACSPDDGYLFVLTFRQGKFGGFKIVEAHIIPNKLSVHELKFPGEYYKAAFSSDSKLFACLSRVQHIWILSVFDISPGPEVNLQASFTFDGNFEWFSSQFPNLTFRKHSPTLLVACNYIMRLEDRRLAVEIRIDKEIQGFSECGGYYYDRNLQLYRLPDNLVPDTSLSAVLAKTRYLDAGWNLSSLRHLTRCTYIDPPHSIQLSCRDGVVFLGHQMVTMTNTGPRRARVIWVQPDAMSSAIVHIYLVWPGEDIENVKLLVVLDKGPTLIDTGIKKGNMMEEDGWFEDDHFNAEWDLVALAAAS